MRDMEEMQVGVTQLQIFRPKEVIDETIGDCRKTVIHTNNRVLIYSKYQVK